MSTSAIMIVALGGVVLLGALIASIAHIFSQRKEIERLKEQALITAANREKIDILDREYESNIRKIDDANSEPDRADRLASVLEESRATRERIKADMERRYGAPLGQDLNGIDRDDEKP